MLVNRLDEHAFAEVLTQAEQLNANLIHVVIVDELTSIRVLGDMNGEALPVTPLSTERSLRDCKYPSRRSLAPTRNAAAFGWHPRGTPA